jgi:23S rRNA (adenine2503-C2)-methyltransferase
LPRRHRITFEYVLLDGVNDSSEDARRLARLLHGIRCKINLIPFNAVPGILSFRRPPEKRVEQFQKILLDKDYTVSVRYSKGQDIGAACGQLAGHAGSQLLYDTAFAPDPGKTG